MDVPLSAEIGLGALERFSERSSFHGKPGLAGAMLMAGVVANGLEEANVE
jgi:hypothetical protein